MDKNMISIIIATKNGARFLPRSIASIEKQTEKDFEVIVVSDGSTDNTVDIIKDKMQDRPWLKLIELRDNVGQGQARDRGIKESQGAYIAFLDDDDEWLSSEKLSVQKEFLDHHPDYVLIGSRKILEIQEDTGRMLEYTNPATDTEIRKQFLRKNCFATSSIMFRKEAYIACGGFRSFEVSEDYDLNIRLGRIGKMANLDRSLVGYTVRSGGSSKARQLTFYKNIIKIVNENKDYYPGYWIGIAKSYARLVYFYLFSNLIPLSRLPRLRKLLRRIG
jgi:glycosyltransferase involved in cell wall biosynthesis